MYTVRHKGGKAHLHCSQICLCQKIIDFAYIVVVNSLKLISNVNMVNVDLYGRERDSYVYIKLDVYFMLYGIRNNFNATVLVL